MIIIISILVVIADYYLIKVLINFIIRTLIKNKPSNTIINSNIRTNSNNNNNNNIIRYNNNTYNNNTYVQSVNNKIDTKPTINDENNSTNQYKRYYRAKRYVITKNELNFYTVLLEIAKELNLIVFSQVSLYNILETRPELDYKTKTIYFNKISCLQYIL